MNHVLALFVIIFSSIASADVTGPLKVHCLHASGYYGDIKATLKHNRVFVRAAQGFAYELTYNSGAGEKNTLYDMNFSFSAKNCVGSPTSNTVLDCREKNVLISGTTLYNQKLFLKGDVELSIIRTAENEHDVEIKLDTKNSAPARASVLFPELGGENSIGGCEFK